MQLLLLNTLLVLSALLLVIYLIISCHEKVSSKKDKRIINEALRLGCSPEFAKILAAQARHETANYTSYLCRYCNNYFGMKYYSGARLHKRRCKNGEYVHYESLENSVEDVIGWLRRRKISVTSKDYVTYIVQLKKAGYFEDTLVNYIGGVYRALQKVG